MATNTQVLAQEWVELILSEKFPGSFFDSLRSGTRLCKLVNTFWPGRIKVKRGVIPKQQTENIKEYLNECKLLGVQIIFEAADLINNENSHILQNEIEARSECNQVLDQIARNILSLKELIYSVIPRPELEKIVANATANKCKTIKNSREVLTESAVQKYNKLKRSHPAFAHINRTSNERNMTVLGKMDIDKHNDGKKQHQHQQQQQQQLLNRRDFFSHEDFPVPQNRVYSQDSGNNSRSQSSVSVSSNEAGEVESLASMSSLGKVSLKSIDSRSSLPEPNSNAPISPKFRLMPQPWVNGASDYWSEQENLNINSHRYLLNTCAILNVAMEELLPICREWEELYARRFPERDEALQYMYSYRRGNGRTSKLRRRRFYGYSSASGDANCGSSISSGVSSLKNQLDFIKIEQNDLLASRTSNNFILVSNQVEEVQIETESIDEWLALNQTSNSPVLLVEENNVGLPHNHLTEVREEKEKEVTDEAMDIISTKTEISSKKSHQSKISSKTGKVEDEHSTSSSVRFEMISPKLETEATSQKVEGFTIEDMNSLYEVRERSLLPDVERIRNAQHGKFRLDVDYLMSLEQNEYQQLEIAIVRERIWLHMLYYDQCILTQCPWITRKRNLLESDGFSESSNTFNAFFKFKSNLVKKLLCYGIPRHLQAEVWLLCSGALERLASNRGYYSRLVMKSISNVPRSVVYEFEKDIQNWKGSENSQTSESNPDRTQQVIEAESRVMRRIIMAIYERASYIGYCPCFVPIIGRLLRIMGEEASFWILIQMVEEILPDDYFTTTLSACVDQFLLFELLGKLDPLLSEHIKELEAKHKETKRAVGNECAFRNEVKSATLTWFMYLFTRALDNEEISTPDEPRSKDYDDANVGEEIDAFFAVSEPSSSFYQVPKSTECSDGFNKAKRNVENPLFSNFLDALFYEGDRALFTTALSIFENQYVNEKLMNSNSLDALLVVLQNVFVYLDATTYKTNGNPRESGFLYDAVPEIQEKSQTKAQTKIAYVTSAEVITKLRKELRGKLITSFFQNTSASAAAAPSSSSFDLGSDFISKDKIAVGSFAFHSLSSSNMWNKKQEYEYQRAGMHSALRAKRILSLKKHRSTVRGMDRASLFVIRNELLQHLFGITASTGIARAVSQADVYIPEMEPAITISINQKQETYSKTT